MNKPFGENYKYVIHTEMRDRTKPGKSQMRALGTRVKGLASDIDREIAVTRKLINLEM